MLRKIGFVALGLVVIAILAFAVAAWVYRDIPAEVLEAKYGDPETSKFIDLDGVRMHYRDEGEGPAIVMLHAHWGSLLMWDSWAAALKDKYRVVRFDMTSHGLTGPDPSGDYSLGRNVDLLERLTDALDIDEMILVGTSVGGTISIHFTSANPERVKQLVLVNPGSLNRRIVDPNKPLELPPGADILKYITPRALFEAMIHQGFGDKSKIPDDLIDRWHDMQLREGQREAELGRLRQYIAGDLKSIVAKITVPTLIVWGTGNEVVPVEMAYEFRDMLTGTKPELKIYDGIGQWPALEAPELTATDIRAYLDAKGF